MTCYLGPRDFVSDPEDPEATLKMYLEEREDTLRRLIGGDLDDWVEKEVSDE